MEVENITNKNNVWTRCEEYGNYAGKSVMRCDVCESEVRP